MTGFRLATVERLRGQELHARAQDLDAAAGTLEMTTVRRDHLLAKLNDTGNLGPASTAVFTGADLQLADVYRERLRAKIEIDAARIVQLQHELDQARVAWLDARAQLRAVQSLHERHRKAVSAERARLEQRALDELASTRRRIPSELAEQEVAP
jgi:flagellar export protein FliJ